MGRVVDQPLHELPLRLREREEYWRQLLDECKSSGQGVTAFARTRDVPAASLFNWRAELARRDRARASAEPELTFLPVAVRTQAAVVDSPLEIVLATGRRVRVGTDFDATAVARLVRLLEDLPC